MPRFLRFLTSSSAAFSFFCSQIHAQAQLPETAVELPIPVRPSACDSGFDFANVPPVRPQPRQGMFPIPPTGPGYYSILDAVRQTPSQTLPTYGYPRFGLMAQSAFDADFKYLDKPDNTAHDLFDPLKRMRLGDDFLLSLGGQTQVRQME